MLFMNLAHELVKLFDSAESKGAGTEKSPSVALGSVLMARFDGGDAWVWVASSASFRGGINCGT